jgi:hypothetical protein
MIGLFKKKTKKQIPYYANSDMTSAKWRSNADQRNLASRLFNSTDFQAIWSIMIHERPSKNPIPLGVSSEVMAQQASFVAGYEYALEKMQSLSNENDQALKEPEMNFSED